MQVYTVHMRRQGLDPDKDIVFVREGFSWTAFAFTFLWAAYHRLWLMMVVTLSVLVLSGIALTQLGVSETVSAIVQICISTMIGFVANDARRFSLARGGFAELDVVVARDRTTAEQRYFDLNPGMAQLIEADA